VGPRRLHLPRVAEPDPGRAAPVAVDEASEERVAVAFSLPDCDRRPCLPSRVARDRVRSAPGGASGGVAPRRRPPGVRGLVRCERTDRRWGLSPRPEGDGFVQLRL